MTSTNNNQTNGVVKEIPLNREDFFKCAGARDTIFTNGDYIKYIPFDNQSFKIELKINNAIETLDFYLNCKTHNGMIPKLLTKSDLDFICLGQGSSSYRYLTLCYYDNEIKKIVVNKFETSIDVQTEIDGFVFNKGSDLFFYSLKEQKLFINNLSSNSLSIKKSVLTMRDSILVMNEKNETFKYSLKDFH
jgi:hypothetical protein